MSGVGACPCHLDWFTDIHGARREPVNNEKAWLIFAVRLLSRTVVGKVNGQETVWNQRFKPGWWDQEVGLAWKNPTTNPKDTKNVLMSKYEALQRHLKDEGKFPEVLEGEARLWNAGKFSDLFLMTSVLGVLEKTIDLHNAVTQLCAKKSSRVCQDLALVGSIKNCLAATLSKLGQLETSGSADLETSNSAVNGRTFSKLGQLETSGSAVLETSDRAVNGRTFSKLGQLKTSGSAVNGRTFSKLYKLETSDSAVLETSDRAVNGRTFSKLGQLKTSVSAVNGRTFSKLYKLETSDLSETSNSAINERTFSKLLQLETSVSTLKDRTFSKLLQLETSDSAVNERTFSKLNQLETSVSTVKDMTFSKLLQLETSVSTVKDMTFSKLLQLETSNSAVNDRTPKRRSSQSSGSSSDVSTHKSQKIDTPAVKNSQVILGWETRIHC